MDIKLKERTNKSRYEFRLVAREVTREIYDIPEGNKVLFAYQTSSSGSQSQTPTAWERARQKNQSACAILSFSLADLSTSRPTSMFDDDYAHMVTFLFVKIDFQRMGVGRKLMAKAMEIMGAHAPDRPIRVESARGAADFFEKLGFVRKREAYETACAGARIFRYIVNMERPPTSGTCSSEWPT